MKIIELKYLLIIVVASGLLTSCFNKDKDEELCSDTCQYANDGVCDDGGPGSAYSLCPCGTDCSDCGDRSESECDGSSSSSSSSSSGGGYTVGDLDGYWWGNAPDGNHWNLYLCSNGLFTLTAINPVGVPEFNHTGNWSVSGTTISLSGSTSYTFQVISANSSDLVVTYSGSQIDFAMQSGDPCATTGSSSSSSSGSSSSGSSSSSSGGGGTYSAVFVYSGAGGGFFGCDGNLTFEVRVASTNALVMSNGVLDPDGATYDGINGPNPPTCFSPNTVYLPNLQEGVTYRWNSSCQTQTGPDEDTGTFDEGPGSLTSDGCRRVSIP